MSSQKHIQDELRSLGSHLPFNTDQPFSVPDGYFDGLAANILAKIKGREEDVQAEIAELSPFLASLPKQMPYSVPSSYFDESTKSLEVITQPDDQSFLFQTIGKELPYQVPANYFGTLPEQILSKVGEPKTKVVPIFARTWMRVASAAAVAGALFFGGYQLLKNEQQTQGTTTAVQQPMNQEDKLVASNLAPIEKEIKKVPTRELEEFIETVQVNTPKASEQAQTVTSNNEEVEDLLKDVPTSEMESFLSALPTADDELLIID